MTRREWALEKKSGTISLLVQEDSIAESWCWALWACCLATMTEKWRWETSQGGSRAFARQPRAARRTWLCHQRMGIWWKQWGSKMNARHAPFSRPRWRSPDGTGASPWTTRWGHLLLQSDSQIPHPSQPLATFPWGPFNLSSAPGHMMERRTWILWPSV